MRYIDPNKLPQRVPHSRYGEGFNDCLDQVLDVVEEKDLVEVVRCKNCKFAWIHPIGNTVHCGRDGRTMYPMVFRKEDFCSYGERKIGVE